MCHRVGNEWAGLSLALRGGGMKRLTVLVLAVALSAIFISPVNAAKQGPTLTFTVTSANCQVSGEAVLDFNPPSKKMAWVVMTLYEADSPDPIGNFRWKLGKGIDETVPLIQDFTVTEGEYMVAVFLFWAKGKNGSAIGKEVTHETVDTAVTCSTPT